MKDWTLAILHAAVAVLAPVQGVMIATAFLICADTFTGIWRSLKRGDRLSSSKLGTTLSKLFLYQLLIITALVMQTHLIPLVPVVSLVSAAIAAREGLSVFENISSITGVDFVTALIEKLNPIKPDKHE